MLLVFLILERQKFYNVKITIKWALRVRLIVILESIYNILILEK